MDNAATQKALMTAVRQNKEARTLLRHQSEALSLDATRTCNHLRSQSSSLFHHDDILTADTKQCLPIYRLDEVFEHRVQQSSAFRQQLPEGLKDA